MGGWVSCSVTWIPTTPKKDPRGIQEALRLKEPSPTRVVLFFFAAD